MRYDLNLARRHFVNTKLPAALAGTLALGIVIFTAFNISVLLSAPKVGRDYESRIQSALIIENEMRDKIKAIKSFLQQDMVTELAVRIRYANELMKRQKLNWTQLFDRLENLTPAKVRMLRISPRIRGEEIVLDLTVDEAAPGAVLNYTSALRRSPYFPEVVLISEMPSPSGFGQKWQIEVTYRNE